MATFERGDIATARLDPVEGHEIRGAVRPALAPLAGSGCKTQGVALTNKIRMLDLSARKARKVKRVPLPVMEDAIGRLSALLA